MKRRKAREWWIPNGDLWELQRYDPKDHAAFNSYLTRVREVLPPKPRQPAARRKGEPLKHAGENCWCSPRVEDYCGRKIVIHNEEQ